MPVRRAAAADVGTHGRSLLDFRHQLGCELGFLSQERLFALDLFLQTHESFQKRFGARGTSRDINIDWDQLIDALQDGVTPIHPTARRARTHRDTPFRFRHLLPDPFNRQGHLVGDGAGDNHDVTLSWRKPHDFGAEPRDIEPGSGCCHQFNRTTGQTHGHGPERVLSHPIHRRIELGENDVALNL